MTLDYGQDVGSLHVIDYYLSIACAAIPFGGSTALLRIGRYLDGEEEREGTYR